MVWGAFCAMETVCASRGCTGTRRRLIRSVKDYKGGSKEMYMHETNLPSPWQQRGRRGCAALGPKTPLDILSDGRAQRGG